MALFAVELRSDWCFVALGRLWSSTWSLLGTSWRQLGASWVHLGLNLEPLERLLGSTCSLLDRFGAHLGAFWTPLGLYLGSPGGLVAQLRSFWAPNGSQVDVKTVFELQMNAKLDCQVGLPQRLPVSTYVSRTSKQLQSPAERLANCGFAAGWRHMQH